MELHYYTTPRYTNFKQGLTLTVYHVEPDFIAASYP
jgi:hypothetical protein